MKGKSLILSIAMAVIAMNNSAPAQYPCRHTRLRSANQRKQLVHVNQQRISAAQAKRDRKNAKRKRDSDRCQSGIVMAAIQKVKGHSRVASVGNRTVFFSVDAEKEWLEREEQLKGYDYDE